MAGLKGDNPVEQLREKLARDARWRVREQYFALRIIPVLLVWALLMAAATVAAGGLISLGDGATRTAAVSKRSGGMRSGEAA